MAKKYAGILKGTEDLINEYLFGKNTHDYRHVAKGRSLRKFPNTNNLNAEMMLKKLIQQIQRNLEERDKDKVGKSKENWREAPQLYLGTRNTSMEVQLERAIVQQSPTGWWNQMPIASGLVHSDHDRRRAIDLVHKYGADSKCYDFIELKIDSDTPLFALMEILLYGLIYLVLRKERGWLPEPSQQRQVFSARFIGLRVLAPKAYFDQYGLSLIEDELTLALSKIIEGLQLEDSLVMEISSHCLPEGWSTSVKTHEGTLSILQNWERAFDY